MAQRAREDLGLATSCLLAYRGIKHPTPDEIAGAALFAHALRDLHVLALGKNLKE